MVFIEAKRLQQTILVAEITSMQWKKDQFDIILGQFKICLTDSNKKTQLNKINIESTKGNFQEKKSQ